MITENCIHAHYSFLTNRVINKYSNHREFKKIHDYIKSHLCAGNWMKIDVTLDSAIKNQNS